MVNSANVFNEDLVIAEFLDAEKIQIVAKLPAQISERNINVMMNLRHYNEEYPNRENDLLQLVASVHSPVYQGKKLQASHVFINHESQQHGASEYLIYVSYNTQGPDFLGAIQILSARRGILKLEQTVIFNDSDIHYIEVRANKLYIAGATNDLRFSTPAMLEIVKLQGGFIPIKFDSSRFDLPSYAATAVLIENGKTYVGVGDIDGGIVKIDSINKYNDEFYKLSDISHSLYPLKDVRDLAVSENNLMALQGTDSGLWVKAMGKDAEEKFIPLDGGNIAESKSSIDLSDQFVFLGLGDGGTQILSIDDFSLVNKIPQAMVEDLDSSLTVTNSVSAGFNEVYTADGEAGARVFNINKNGQLKQIASIRFKENISVNSVSKFGEYVVFAAGLGGVKIAKLYRSDSTKKNNEDLFYSNITSGRNDDD